MVTVRLDDPSQESFAKALKEYGSTPEIFLEKALEIQQWIRQQPHLPDVVVDLESIKNTLIKCKCSTERTKQVWDMNFTLKTALPEFFSNRDPQSPLLQDVFNLFDTAALPQTTKNGYRIIVVRQNDKEVKDTYSLYDQHKLVYMIADLMLSKDKSLGTIGVMDMKHFQLKQLQMDTITTGKKIEAIGTKAYTTRIGGIHVLNAPSYAHLFIKMVKTFSSPKIKSRVFSHASLDELHQHIERELLPRDYGGDEPRTLKQLSDELRAEMESKRSWFLEQEKICRVDESKRPGKQLNHTDLFGFEGSFKQLSFD